MSLFTELMKAAYPHLSEGMNVAPYMRSMISRLCSVPEELWYTSRDKTPDAARADTTLEQYYKRGASKKLAREMLNNPTRREFVDSLDYIEGDFDEKRRGLGKVAAIKAQSERVRFFASIPKFCSAHACTP